MSLIPPDLISKILAPALRLWLRSQVEAVEELEIHIDGKDGQILRGYVPGVFLNSRRAIYQGLQLGTVLVKGENIRINIGQIIKGKPLQLLEPIRVSGELQLAQTDLEASLNSDILSNAFNELLIALLELKGIENPPSLLAPYQIQWQAIALESNSFTLKALLLETEKKPIPIRIQANLTLLNAQTLHLQDIELEGLPGVINEGLTNFPIDLGTDVEIESLALSPGELSCLGRILIRP